MQWFRWWNDGVTDPKLLRLSLEHRWLWLAILTLASESPIRGSLYVTEHMPCNLDDVARKANLPAKVAQAGIDTMMSKPFSMLHLDGNGAWEVTHWQQRQPARDDSSGRVGDKRKRDGNAQGELQSGPVKRDCNAQTALQGGPKKREGNSPVTRPDSDTDSDTEKTHDDDEEEATDAMGRIERLPDDLRDNWGRAYQFLCVVSPSGTEFETMRHFTEAGMTDRLIVAALIVAIQEGAKTIIPFTAKILSGLAPHDVSTPEEWEAHKIMQVAAKEQRAQERATANVRPIRGKQPTSRSNVFLDRESPGKKDDAYYDHIYRRFDERPVAN